MLDAATLIMAFRDTERWYYSDTDQNVFAIALSQIDRYYRFLQIIKDRLDSASKPFVKIQSDLQQGITPGVRQVNEDEYKAMQESSLLQKNIQLDIESFYIFGKITLDKIANFIEQYFGPGRGCSLRSHDRLVADFAKYSALKSLSVPGEFMELAANLKETISDFRDKQIEHHRNPRRTMGIAWSEDANLLMIPGHLNPKESDTPQRPSTPLSAILIEIEKYLESLFELIRRNRYKGTYAIREKK